MYPEFTTQGTTTIFVRHPFERILSAFRDKLEDPGVQGHKFNEYYYNKHGRRIVMHYRKQSVTGPTWKYPRFSEFLDYLLGKDLRYVDEQIDKHTGKQASAENLTWSYANILHALHIRKGLSPDPPSPTTTSKTTDPNPTGPTDDPVTTSSDNPPEICR